ncbi:hypothetical protein QUW58_23000 [Enterocloster aldenensis]|uniref:hypothetical protein n=1 Tax=Enterocloster aldenensis TaxID=358742 RepID=UPI0020631F4A|nr:hypothetical protein [Enterocloster aldenensis]DAG76327.1 MAG TPA: minor tail protein Z [Caudoviricetes sp.]
MKEMFLIGVNTDEVKQKLSRAAPDQQMKLLKKALKKTAEQARIRLAEQAQDSYTVKNVGFKKEMRIRQRGGFSSPAAIIESSGQPLELIRYKTSWRRRTAKVQVVKPGRLKPLTNSFKNNVAKEGSKRHLAIAERVGKERLPIKTKFSSSIPVMLGSSKHVYGIVEPHIGSDLQKNLERFIDQSLGG